MSHAPPGNGTRDGFRGNTPQSDGASRILLVISALGAGGAERVIISLTNHLVGRGCQVTLVSFEPPGTPPYYIVDRGADLRQLGIAAGPKPLRQSLARVRALRRVTRDCQPDVVISFLVKINVLVTLATRGLNVPVVVSERNNPERQRIDPLWSWLRARLYPLAFRIVTPSRGILECFPPSIRRRGRIIPNPVDLSPPRPRRDASRTIVAVGRLVHQKGFDLLLRAFAEIATNRPDWTLVIFGEGEERLRLECLRDELGLTGRILMPGITRQPGEWVENAEIFVLSSRFESFGNVITEAMAAGLPVVAFDCPWGPGEIIRHEIDALLVAPEDVAALARALLLVTGDAALRCRLGEAARHGVQRFEREHVMRSWDDLIAEALQRAAPRDLAESC